ncbi:hypothetical protein MRS76_12810 [Rhizobiaceae bacterium n13]|uniref:helix-turn-helix transcriptional regulator n=1 Tax=Ferirhizobium litorale TaxID=2927786 RepID=UPI0024B2B360|nr:hypothetical protein [Fererhizobium litorale]MDI7862839.1 hypothetical protein [Fererhizobium litorale]
MSNICKTLHSPSTSLQHNDYARASGVVDPDINESPWDTAETAGRTSAEHQSTIGSTPSAATVLSSASERFLSDRMVAERYGVSKQTIWRWSQGSSDFPKPIKFEGGTTRWLLSDLVAYERKVKGARR